MNTKGGECRIGARQGDYALQGKGVRLRGGARSRARRSGALQQEDYLPIRFQRLRIQPSWTFLRKHKCRSSSQQLSSPKPGHTTGGTGRRTAGRRGEARTARTGRRRVGSPRRHPFSYIPGDRRKPSWACFWKHEQRKPYANRWRNKTRG